MPIQVIFIPKVVGEQFYMKSNQRKKKNSQKIKLRPLSASKIQKNEKISKNFKIFKKKNEKWSDPINFLPKVVDAFLYEE